MPIPSTVTTTSPQQSTAPEGINIQELLANAMRPVGADADASDRVDWLDPEAKAMSATWRRGRDAYQGTDGLLARPQRYLPKHKKEKPEDYKTRCEHSAAFNAFYATVNGLTSMAFAKEPTLGDDVHEQLREHAENIDGAGTPLNVFARELTEEGFTVGTSGFMVLYPPRPEGATAFDEKQGVLRPYWRHIAVEDVYSWDHATVGAREYLTRLVVREQVKRRKGRYGSELVTTYREFIHDVETGGIEAPVLWIQWEERKTDATKRSEFVPIGGGFITTKTGQSLSRIPYVGVLLGRRQGKMFARPALKDLLDLMLKAFRIDSDRTYLMHIGCVPIPMRKGYRSRAATTRVSNADGSVTEVPRADTGATFGINVLQDLPADTKEAFGVDFRWVEITGNAFNPTKDELEKLKAEMGAMGLQFLAPSTRAAETEGARRIDARVENASLSAMMSRVESAIEEGLILHAEYLGIAEVQSGEQSGGSWTVNRDYERTVLSVEMIKAYAELVTLELLTHDTFLDILQQGRALNDGFDAKTEIRRLRLISTRHQKQAEEAYARAMASRRPASKGKEQPDDGDDFGEDDAPGTAPQAA
jgi:hypothetical protein